MLHGLIGRLARRRRALGERAIARLRGEVSTSDRALIGTPEPRSRAFQRRPLAPCALAALTVSVLLLVTAPARAEPEPVHLVSVERFASEKTARIVLRFSGPVTFKAGAFETPGGGPPRLYVDVPGAVYAGMHSFEMAGLVQRIRLLPVESTLRVMLDVAGPAEHDAFYLPDPFRIVIDVSPPAARAQPAPSGGRRIERIALDPGHGGSEPGAIGRLGLQEKDVVLDIAHRAAPLLARELGVSTLLTRDGDVKVPLEERVAKANAFGADIFVSIHCNAASIHSARGVMTFVLDGSHDRGASDAIVRENATPNADPNVLAKFLVQFSAAPATAQSTRFARLLQRATLASLAAGYPDASDGGVHGAGFYVLAGARMPAVLFETSFVSNGIEEQRLGTARYRQKLADGIVNAVRAYRAGY
jgi:N-acetylmuramoyl-L-alanine amidase